jgi:OmpA-OmpF porin, OOP family
VENIHFEFDKWYLKKKSLDILDRIINVMKGRRNLKIEVRGHTDSTGKPSYNKKLSEKRADAVVEYMIKNGISPERVVSKGLGETKPIASNKTREGRRKNRRTEFFFLKSR